MALERKITQILKSKILSIQFLDNEKNNHNFSAQIVVILKILVYVSK